MRKIFSMAVLLGVLFFNGTAYSGEVRYLSFCRHLDADPETIPTSVKAVTISCVAFITGVVETHKTIFLETGIAPLYCKPSRTTYGDVARMYNEYAIKNPPEAGISETEALLKALKKNYPCK